MNNTIRTLLTAATVVVGSLTGYAVEPDAPGCVTSVKFSHDYNGNAVIGISFNAPAETYEGNTLTQITDLKIYRDDTLLKTYTQPAPGEALTLSDTTPEKKEYTYRFVASNTAGEGEEVEEYVYVGADYAAPATNVSLRESVENPGTAIISWDAPATYQEGSPINPSLVSYEILAADGVTSLKAGIVGTTTEIEVCGADERTLANFFIISVTERGANYSKYAMTPLLALGQAYETDYLESFNGAAPATLCGGLNDFLRGSWSYVASLDSPAVTPFDNDGGFAAYKPRKSGNESAWYSGKIAVPANASETGWSFRYFGVANSKTTLQPFVYADGVITYDTQFKLGDNGEGWQQYNKSIDEYAGKNIQVGVKIVAGDKKHVAIDHVFVSGGTSPQISLSDFSIPDRVPVNGQINGSITVVNNSNDDMYINLNIEKNAEQFTSYSQEHLEAGKSFTQVFDDIAPNQAGTVEYTVSVLTANSEGENEEIARSAKTITVTDKGYPTPQNGVCHFDDSVIEWGEPDYRNFFTSNQVTDDIESYEPLAIDKAGDWKFVDADGVEETYSFTDFSFPNMGKPMSYIVFDSEGMNNTFAAASGTKYFASFSSPYGANDNWLISPDLPGTEATLTFKARSYSTQDPESFEVLTSAATRDVADFTLLAAENDVPATWTDYTYTLPAGTNFFAIRSTSNDKFYLLVDDIEYTRGVGNLILEGYEIYHNFELLGTVDANTTSYQYSEVFDPDCIIQIKAVYNRGKSELSEPCNKESVGIGSVQTDTAEETARYNAAGLRVDKNAKGIVFIKYSDGSVRKVIIR